MIKETDGEAKTWTSKVTKVGEDLFLAIPKGMIPDAKIGDNLYLTEVLGGILLHIPNRRLKDLEDMTPDEAFSEMVKLDQELGLE